MVASGDRQAVAVQQSGVEQGLHHHRDAADAVDVVHDVGTERLDVGQVRNLGAHPGEVGQDSSTSASWAMASWCNAPRWWTRRTPSPRRWRSRTLPPW